MKYEQSKMSKAIAIYLWHSRYEIGISAIVVWMIFKFYGVF